MNVEIHQDYNIWKLSIQNWYIMSCEQYLLIISTDMHLRLWNICGDAESNPL